MAFVSRRLRRRHQRTIEELRRAYPFHRMFFGDQGLIGFSMQRSIVTSMGTTLYPTLAELIARERFRDVHREHSIEGSLNDAAVNMIEQVVTELRSRRREPDHDVELELVLDSRGGGDSSRSVTADLFIGDFRPGPAFFELTGPTPNLNVAAGLKRNLLYYLAIERRRGTLAPQGWIAFHHNPFLTRSDYNHPFTKQVLDLQKEVLMGSEFWDLIGGSGCYTQIMDVIEEVLEETEDLRQ